ncbi:hypothetical protein [Siminovitchia sp. 179-K 8D1 HS]|uniref:hypothetical protein n=1 Tax=Siminovitchia sp. 179-K 8D1 HS TaxID=3142385 RepID=UPI00399FFBAC
MSIAKKNLFEISDEQIENEYIVSDLTKFHHLLTIGIGILPFVIASIWYSITY